MSCVSVTSNYSNISLELFFPGESTRNRTKWDGLNSFKSFCQFFRR